VKAAAGATPATVPITLAPLTIGNTVGDVSENLSVALGNGPTTTVALKMRVHGALIALATTSGNILRHSSATFGITNKGNDAISLCYQYSANSPNAWQFEADARDDFAAGATDGIDVTYTGQGISTGATGNASVKIVACPTGGGVGTAIPSCGTLPATLTLFGH
jgi:hypothetical protein